ncbi:MAG: hypothetical protein ACJ77K_06745 [Bacteroidia bacterium]
MKRSGYFLLPIVVAVCFSSCKQSITSTADFNKYVNNPENGCQISRSINGVKMTVTYLPPQYVTLKEMEESGLHGKNVYDSLLHNNKASSYFLMTLAPVDDNSGDIMYKGLKNYKEYAERAMTLNFDLEQQIVLQTDHGELSPVLSSLENTYGLTKDRKVDIVFSSSEGDIINASHFDFTYSDETYGIGTVHFEYDKKNINENLPEVVFPKS